MGAAGDVDRDHRRHGSARREHEIEVIPRPGDAERASIKFVDEAPRAVDGRGVDEKLIRREAGDAACGRHDRPRSILRRREVEGGDAQARTVDGPEVDQEGILRGRGDRQRAATAEEIPATRLPRRDQCVFQLPVVIAAGSKRDAVADRQDSPPLAWGNGAVGCHGDRAHDPSAAGERLRSGYRIAPGKARDIESTRNTCRYLGRCGDGGRGGDGERARRQHAGAAGVGARSRQRHPAKTRDVHVAGPGNRSGKRRFVGPIELQFGVVYDRGRREHPCRAAVANLKNALADHGRAGGRAADDERAKTGLGEAVRSIDCRVHDRDAGGAAGRAVFIGGGSRAHEDGIHPGLSAGERDRSRAVDRVVARHERQAAGHRHAPGRHRHASTGSRKHGLGTRLPGGHGRSIHRPQGARRIPRAAAPIGGSVAVGRPEPGDAGDRRGVDVAEVKIGIGGAADDRQGIDHGRGICRQADEAVWVAGAVAGHLGGRAVAEVHRDRAGQAGAGEIAEKDVESDLSHVAAGELHIHVEGITPVADRLEWPGKRVAEQPCGRGTHGVGHRRTAHDIGRGGNG